MPSSPPAVRRVSTPIVQQHGRPFLDDFFEIDEDLSIKQKLDILIEDHKALFKLFSDFIKERKDCSFNCKCKCIVARNEGLESEKLNVGDSIKSNSKNEGGEDRCFVETSSVDDGREAAGGLSSFNLLSGEDVTDTGEEVDNVLREAIKLKSKSCSVGNFAQKMIQLLSEPHELINRNCTGTRGKQGLDPIKLEMVKGYVFKLYPCAKSLEDAQWRKCITCMDEYLRRKKKDFREN